MKIICRGDVQPFLALSKELEKYDFEIGFATHLQFKDFVVENGPKDLQFFELAGDIDAMQTYFFFFFDLFFCSQMIKKIEKKDSNLKNSKKLFLRVE